MQGRAPLEVIDWGRRGYASSLGAQRERQTQVIEQTEVTGPAPHADVGEALILVEHDPVITVTPRATRAGHVLASAERLAGQGVVVHETDRGGDATAHNPGQLVAYPILHLPRHGLNLSRHMRLLESVAIDTAEAFGVSARREAGLTGVWVGGEGGPPEKLCAMGVRIRRGVTMHGLAFNVDNDLSVFEAIVPCGLRDRGVTSLARLLGPRRPAMEEVKRVLVDRFFARLQESRASAPGMVNGAPGISA